MMTDKRKVGVLLGALLIFIPFLTMGFITDASGTYTYKFMDIFFPPENTLAAGFFPFKGVVYPLLVLSVISVILNLVKKPFVVLSVIVGILTLGLHALFYYWVAGSFILATLGVAWYIIGVGCILLVISPFLKKSS